MKKKNARRYVRPILRLTVLPDGRIDVCYFAVGPRGTLLPVGQRFTIAPNWAAVMDILSPSSEVRVHVDYQE